MPAHTHSHAPDPDAPPPDPAVLLRRRRATWLMLLQSRTEQAVESFQPPGTTYPQARVVSLETVDCSASAPAGQQLTCGTAVLEVTEGDSAGDFVQIDLPPEVIAAGVAVDDTLVPTWALTHGFSDFTRSTATPLRLLARFAR